MESVLTPRLCREARALLDLEIAEVAFVARIPVSELERFEAGGTTLPATSITALRRFFERSGAVFAPDETKRGVLLQDFA